jgi:hypothetical protein
VLLWPGPAGYLVVGVGPGVGNLVGDLAIEVASGTPFFLPIFVFIGESYVQPVPPDDPADFEGLFLDNPGFCDFEGLLFGCPLSVVITVDGDTLIDSSTDDVTDFYSGPVFFEPPIVYDEPINRGVDLDAEAAIWVEGFGFAHSPLSEGVHELHLLVYTGLGFGFDNTWTITVIDDD